MLIFYFYLFLERMTHIAFLLLFFFLTTTTKLKVHKEKVECQKLFLCISAQYTFRLISNVDTKR
jgi:hypothetical protein